MAFASCFSCVKYAVFLFNFFLWLLGCSLLALGSWLLTDQNAGRFVEQVTSTSTDSGDSGVIVSYSQVTGSQLTSTLAYLFIAVGASCVFVAFIGCCGAVRESQCLLVTFFVTLFLVFSVMLGITIWAFVSRNNVDAHTFTLRRLTNHMVRDAVKKYYADKNAQAFMNSLHKKFRCCGADNAAGDYDLATGPLQQPPCDVANQRHGCLAGYYYHVGDVFEDFMRSRLTIVAAVALAFAVALVLGMLSILLLYCAIKERRWSTSTRV